MTRRLRQAPARSAPAGFTLFEVMAAVLVLGVLYSVLATSAIEGLRIEGESRRRLEASLLADAHLVDLESGLEAGVVPEIGPPQETEVDGYRISVEVTPFDITEHLGEDFLDQQEGDGVESLLEPADRPEESLLRLISVLVRWDEAGAEHEVRRLTLAYDQATVVGLFPEAGGGDDEAVGPSGLEDIDTFRRMLEEAAP